MTKPEINLTNWRGEIDEMVAAFQRRSAGERATAILRGWSDLIEKKTIDREAISEDLKRSFCTWLNNSRELSARESALRHVTTL
jgi:hypothetical protein